MVVVRDTCHHNNSYTACMWVQRASCRANTPRGQPVASDRGFRPHRRPRARPAGPLSPLHELPGVVPARGFPSSAQTSSGLAASIGFLVQQMRPFRRLLHTDNEVLLAGEFLCSRLYAAMADLYTAQAPAGPLPQANPCGEGQRGDHDSDSDTSFRPGGVHLFLDQHDPSEGHDWAVAAREGAMCASALHRDEMMFSLAQRDGETEDSLQTVRVALEETTELELRKHLVSAVLRFVPPNHPMQVCSLLAPARPLPHGAF